MPFSKSCFITIHVHHIVGKGLSSVVTMYYVSTVSIVTSNTYSSIHSVLTPVQPLCHASCRVYSACDQTNQLVNERTHANVNI